MAADLSKSSDKEQWLRAYYSHADRADMVAKELVKRAHLITSAVAVLGDRSATAAENFLCRLERTARVLRYCTKEIRYNEWDEPDEPNIL